MIKLILMTLGTSLSDLWQRILSQSNLASAIAHVYSAIAASKIAHVYINESIDLSLQIPIIQDTAVLPSLIEPQMPGLYVKVFYLSRVQY